MTYLEKNKQEAEKYERMQRADWELKSAIKTVRENLSLKDIASIIKRTLAPEEVESLIKELK